MKRFHSAWVFLPEGRDENLITVSHVYTWYLGLWSPTTDWESKMSCVQSWKLWPWLPTRNSNTSGSYANWLKGTLMQVLNTNSLICTSRSYLQKYLLTSVLIWLIFHMKLSIQNNSDYHKLNILKKKKSLRLFKWTAGLCLFSVVSLLLSFTALKKSRGILQSGLCFRNLKSVLYVFLEFCTCGFNCNFKMVFTPWDNFK